MSSTPTELYQLSNFASLFEVAIGLNLVFAIWEGLRNQAIVRFKNVALELENDLRANLGERYKASRCATKFSEKQDGFIKELEIIAMTAKWCGFAISSILILTLIYIGFYPDLEVSFPLIVSLIIMAVFVSPVFMIVGNYHVRKSRIKLDEYKQQQSNAMADLQDFSVVK